MEQGLLQVYTGEGKGKTTAAVGLAVRALGQGLRVLLVQFLKPLEPASGELNFLEGTPKLEVLRSGEGVLGGAVDREAVAAGVAATLDEARQRIVSGACDLAILDEVNNAVYRGYLPLASLLELIEARPATVELVLTGRHAHPEVLARADLVTRMAAEKHPFAAGIAARRGIEY